MLERLLAEDGLLELLADDGLTDRLLAEGVIDKLTAASRAVYRQLADLTDTINPDGSGIAGDGADGRGVARRRDHPRLRR